MKSIKELFSFFKKKEPAKIQPKERKDHSLERFVDAQERVYERALAEVKSGKKLTHWIWYIFPQLKELSESNNSRYYGIDNIEEARAYLQHPILGVRLREITSVFLDSIGKNAQDIFGGFYAMKVCSCMTLFNEVAEDNLFKKVIDRCYSGFSDEKTLAILGKLNTYKFKNKSNLKRRIIKKEEISTIYDGIVRAVCVETFDGWANTNIEELKKGYVYTLEYAVINRSYSTYVYLKEIKKNMFNSALFEFYVNGYGLDIINDVRPLIRSLRPKMIERNIFSYFIKYPKATDKGLIFLREMHWCPSAPIIERKYKRRYSKPTSKSTNRIIPQDYLII